MLGRCAMAGERRLTPHGAAAADSTQVGQSTCSLSFPGGLLLRQLRKLNGKRTPDCASVHLGIACMCPRQQIRSTGSQQHLPQAMPCTHCVLPARSQERPFSHPWLLPWCGMCRCGGMAGLTWVGVLLQGRSCWTPTARS